MPEPLPLTAPLNEADGAIAGRGRRAGLPDAAGGDDPPPLELTADMRLAAPGWAADLPAAEGDEPAAPPSAGSPQDPPPVTRPPVTRPPVTRETLALPPGPSGLARMIEVLRFGAPGARPKVYLQAGLHADELPGMFALRTLAAMLTEEAERGRILGEVVVVPICNPVGLSQHPHGMLTGRYETHGGENFNRGWPDVTDAVATAIDGFMVGDSAQNVATIRAAMAAEAAALPEATEMEGLRKALYGLAHDADYVLDLHADNEADVHLYIGTPLWPDAADLAAEIDARAVLLAEVSGGNPFDEAIAGPWWALARRFPGYPVPPAAFACTVELRCNNTVDEQLARDDANALLRFMKRRGAVEGSAGALPNLRAAATPLDGMQQLTAPAEGLVLYHVRLGDLIEAGELVAEIIEPLGGRHEIRAETAGVLFARHEQRFAWAGRVIGKIAGAEPLASRMGTTLLPA